MENQLLFKGSRMRNCKNNNKIEIVMTMTDYDVDEDDNDDDDDGNDVDDGNNDDAMLEEQTVVLMGIKWQRQDETLEGIFPMRNESQ